jgi:hypothetical protein
MAESPWKIQNPSYGVVFQGHAGKLACQLRLNPCGGFCAAHHLDLLALYNPMQDQQILRKEDKLTFNRGGLSGKVKGTLVLTRTELSFVSEKDVLQFNISLKDIFNVRAQTLDATKNIMTISCMSEDKERKIEVGHSAFWQSLGTPGFKLREPYFKSWENLIEQTRLNPSELSSSGLNDLQKLAELRDQGILTEEEFTAKKKQLLGI